MKRIKTFLILTALLALGMMSMSSAMADGHGSIVDIAAENGNFTTLLAAADAAGLATMLDENGPFTVLAPTDAAFALLPEGTVEALLEEPEGALRQILLYHIIQGAVPAEEVVGLDAAQTALGKYIGIEVVDGGVVINGGANVVITDIVTENGIIHVIDAILLPPAGWGTTNIGTAVVGDGTDDGGGDTPTTPTGDNGDLIDNMKHVRMIIESMGGLLDRLYRGETQTCAEYLGYYRGLEMAPVIDGMNGFQDIYLNAIEKVKETNENVKIICEDGGGSLSGLSRDVARTGINKALDMLIPAIDEFEATMAMPVDDAPVDTPADDAPADTPADDAPVDTPADDAPADTPVDDAPADDTSEDMPMDDTPAPIAAGVGQLFANLQMLRSTVGAMGWELDQLNSGNNVCASYMMHYEKLQSAPMIENLGPALAAVQADVYKTAIDNVLDASLAVYETCQNDSSLTSLNYGVARVAVNDALDSIEPIINALEPADDAMPEEMPANEDTAEETEETPESVPAANANPIDTNADGVISEEEEDVALSGYFDRIDMQVDNGPLSFDSTTFFIDMLIVHDIFADTTVLLEEDDCEVYAVLLLALLLTPQYEDVPEAWEDVYDAYLTSVSEFIIANTDAVDECEENGVASEEAKKDVESGTVDAQALIQEAIDAAAEMMDIPTP